MDGHSDVVLTQWWVIQRCAVSIHFPEDFGSGAGAYGGLPAYNYNYPTLTGFERAQVSGYATSRFATARIVLMAVGARYILTEGLGVSQCHRLP